MAGRTCRAARSVRRGAGKIIGFRNAHGFWGHARAHERLEDLLRQLPGGGAPQQLAADGGAEVKAAALGQVYSREDLARA